MEGLMDLMVIPVQIVEYVGKGKFAVIRQNPVSREAFGALSEPLAHAEHLAEVMASGDRKTVQFRRGDRILMVTLDKLGDGKALEQVEDQTDLETDPLTGLFNRRAYDRHIAEMVAMGERYQTAPFSLVVVDIDRFKEVNDNFGHETGDRVLQAVAGIVRQSVRKSDVAARYGGEEIAVLMPRTTAGRAAEIVERIRRICPPHCWEQAAVPGVTFSAGVTEHRPGETLVSLFQRADQALYSAKGNGRNRTVVAE